MKKRLYLLMLIAAVSSLAACSSRNDGKVTKTGIAETETTGTVDTEETKKEQEKETDAESADKNQDMAETEHFELTQEGKEFLQSMCFYLPDFSGESDFTETFWFEFLFLSYTGCYEADDNDIETVKAERKDLGFTEDVNKVSLEKVKAYVLLALGVELPDYQPSFEEMNEGQTSFFFDDGYYYIGLSDFGETDFEFLSCTEKENGSILAEYAKLGFGETDWEQTGSVTFRLEKADNDNGFIIVNRATVYQTAGNVIDESADRYKMCTDLPAEEVEGFAARVRQFILASDWEGLSKVISYPVAVGAVTYQSREEFLEGDIQAVIDEDFIKAIEAESCRDLFCNWQGIMLGETGQIWIGDVYDETQTSHELKVTGINGQH